MAMDTEKEAFIAFLLQGSQAALKPGNDEPGTSPGWTMRRYAEGDRLLLTKRQHVTLAATPYRIVFTTLAFYGSTEEPKPEDAIWHLMYNGRVLEASAALNGLEPPQRAGLVQSLEDFLTKVLLANDDPTQMRGPPAYEDGDWVYICEQKGDFVQFEGTETVLYKDEVVYASSFKGQIRV